MKAFYKKLEAIEEDLKIINEKDKESSGYFEGPVKLSRKILNFDDFQH